MQHPLYVGAMLPHMALPPESHFPYYPYMYPPAPFAIGNPHMYVEPVTGPGKREWTGPDKDRKEYREAESESRERNERYFFLVNEELVAKLAKTLLSLTTTTTKNNTF